MPKMTMVQAINLALDQEMARDDGVVCLGEDIGRNEGVFRVTAGLFNKYGEARVIDTPLAESGILGTSIGMALAGLRPVAEMQFSGFSYLMFHQLEGYASRLSEWCSNARALLAAAIRDPDPVIFMEPKRSYRAFREEVPEVEEIGEIGKSRAVEEGTDITVIGWGAMVPFVLQAAADVRQARQASIEVIDLLTISPMDSETFTASVRKTGRCVVVQEAPRSLGVSSEVVARINDQALMYLEAPVARITGYDVVTPYFGREMGYIPSVGRIRRAIEETLDF